MTVSEMLLSGFIYALVGSFTGVMAGILGIGGGVIVVPGLLFVFRLMDVMPDSVSMHVAAASSLSVMIVTSLSSLRAHFKIGEVLFSIYKKMAAGLVIGTICGALLATIMPTRLLQILFAVFLLFVAVKMITDLHVTHPSRFPNNWINSLVSYLIGLKSGLLGVGGGVLVVPYLTYCGVSVRQIAAVSSLCTLTVGVVGSFVLMQAGSEEMSMVPYSTGFIYWPAVLSVALFSSLMAPVGAKLNYIAPVQVLKYCFIVVLIITAVSMFF